MAAEQDPAMKLFSVKMRQGRRKSSIFYISGGSAHIGIRCREAKGL
jgi:hypothetical protein